VPLPSFNEPVQTALALLAISLSLGIWNPVDSQLMGTPPHQTTVAALRLWCIGRRP